MFPTSSVTFSLCRRQILLGRLFTYLQHHRLFGLLQHGHSKRSDVPAFLANYAGDATLRMLEEVTQFDFYDNPEDVTRAADTVAAHFAAASGTDS